MTSLGMPSSVPSVETSFPSMLPVKPSVDDGNIAHLFSRASFAKAAVPSSVAVPAPNLSQKQVPNVRACPLSYANVLQKDSESEAANTQSFSTITDAGSGYKAIKIAQSIYNERIEVCKFSIIGRITLSKGDSPWRHDALKLRLGKIWGITSDWKLISLGKGFYHIVMSSSEEINNVWSRGALALRPGIMRFSAWKPGFDPNTHRSSTCQVWVKFHNLPWEFWDKRILTDIARGVGVPVRFDRQTLHGEFGHYARVLVDVDLFGSLKDFVRVDTDSSKLWVPVEYEALPSICDHCKAIGHVASQCRKNQNNPLAKEKDEVVMRKNEDADKVAPKGRSKARSAWQRKVSPPPPPGSRAKDNSIPNPERALMIVNDGSHIPKESPINIRPLRMVIQSPVLHSPCQTGADQWDSDSEVEEIVADHFDDQLKSSDNPSSSAMIISEVQSQSIEDWETVMSKRKKKEVAQLNSGNATRAKRPSQPPARYRTEADISQAAEVEEESSKTANKKKSVGKERSTPTLVQYTRKKGRSVGELGQMDIGHQEIVVHPNAAILHSSPINVNALKVKYDFMQQVPASPTGKAQCSSWADQFGSGSDQEEEGIDTENIEQMWNPQKMQTSLFEDINSDPEGWNTVTRQKPKYTPASHIELPVIRDTRLNFRVGSKRQVRAPNRYR